MFKCPNCQTETLVKAGLNRSGSQRYQCKACRRYTTPVPKANGYPLDDHIQTLKYYLEGNGLRRIGRYLHVAHQTVANWLKVAHQQLPQPIPLPEASQVTELDELFTFVGQKKTKCTSSQPWIVPRVALSGML